MFLSIVIDNNPHDRAAAHRGWYIGWYWSNASAARTNPVS